MKIIIMVFGAALAFSPFYVRGEEEMIDYVRSVFRDDGPVFTGRCEEVRELKYPGQMFVHEIAMTVQGSGQAVTPRCWGWFKDRRTVYITHISNVMLIETIESTEKELEEGVVRSRYRVQNLHEELRSATCNVELGPLSVSAVGKWLKGVCEKVGSDKIVENKWWWTAPPVKIFYLMVNGLDKKIASDGTWIADREYIEKNMPGYSAAVGKLHDFDGTELTSTWQFGKGYSSIRFDKTSLSKEDKNMIAKLIYRTNPLSVNDVLPEGKQGGDSWVIDSRVIGGAVFDLGLDFDNVDGAVRCRHNGVDLLDKDDAADEFRLLKKEPMRSISLEIPRDSRNGLKLISRNGKMGDIALSFSPYGTITVFDEHDENRRHIYYLRELRMDGTVTSRISKTASLLKDVEFKGSDLKVKLTYVQTRAR